ncbi:MAG TPA: hypothetical protein VKM55_24780 [Candidatus Lokiarchaeia archaeon]|nr:hypothetical protein [Candidatus Lokiarchaeia archaeon]
MVEIECLGKDILDNATETGDEAGSVAGSIPSRFCGTSEFG